MNHFSAIISIVDLVVNHAAVFTFNAPRTKVARNVMFVAAVVEESLVALWTFDPTSGLVFAWECWTHS